MSHGLVFELQDLSHLNHKPKPLYPVFSEDTPDPYALATQLSINDEKEWTKRCMNCQQYYHESTNKTDSCRYHIGVLKDVYTCQSISGALQKKWSCCGIEVSDGCRVGKHKEDKRTSSILQNFETRLSMAPPSSVMPKGPLPEPVVLNTPIEIPHKEEETELFKRGKDGVLYLKYRVNSSVDTLSGVAVKHGLTKKKLKMLNSLWDDTEFYGRSYVLVPWDENKPVPDQRDALRAEEEARKRNLVRRFMQEHKVSTEEAFWYLDDCDYNYQAATEAREADVQWEKTQKLPKTKLSMKA